MRKDLTKQIHSSFLSCGKDTETILYKLFIEYPEHAEKLKRLLVIQAKDCLDNTESQVYKDAIEKATLPLLVKNGYIKNSPKIKLPEHEEVKSYIMISFDNFTPNANNPQFRDCTVTFDIICNSDYWELGDYRLRPLEIAGYIDGLLNETRLSGIGTLNFMGCKEALITPDFNGYSLFYRAIHGSDDIIPSKG